MTRRCFDNLEKPKNEKPQRCSAKQDASIGLMLHSPQHACQSNCFARVSVERSNAQEDPKQ